MVKTRVFGLGLYLPMHSPGFFCYHVLEVLVSAEFDSCFLVYFINYRGLAWLTLGTYFSKLAQASLTQP